MWPTTSTTAVDAADRESAEGGRTGDPLAGEVSGQGADDPSAGDPFASGSPQAAEPGRPPASWWPSFESLWHWDEDVSELWAESDEAEDP